MRTYQTVSSRLLALVFAGCMAWRAAAADSCPLYPIALAAQRITNAAPGDVIADILNGAQAGNFGWLTWAGSPNEPTLVKSLTGPDSATYVNPDASQDHQVSIGDWVQGKPGVSNAKAVRDALDALKQIDITVPIWNQTRGSGASAAYRVSGFARIRLLSYQLPGQNRISARYLGAANCGQVNQAPVVDAGQDLTVVLPSSATLSGTASDDGAPAGSSLALLWTQVSGPAAASISSPQSATTAVSFSEAGTYIFRLTATDGALATFDEVVVVVNRPNQAPIAFSQGVTNREDTTLSIQLTGSDSEGSNLVFYVVTTPAHGMLVGDPPFVQYTPLADYNGSDSFTFKVSDGQLESSIATVTITNLPVNDAPIAASDEISTQEDSPVTFTFSGSDVDGDALTFQVLQQPAHGSLVITATNATYHPATNYHGPDSFIYAASDGQTSSAPALVSIDVISVDDAPTVDAGPDQIISLPTVATTVTGTVIDDDFTGTFISSEWTLVSGPAAVSFTDATAVGTTVTFASNGVYVLRLTATDSLLTSSDDVTVTVNAPPFVSAGASQLVTLPASAPLSGAVSDDGLPVNQLSSLWTASGPGAVVFGDPTLANTTAAFSESGVYTLTLVADDTLAKSSNSTTVVVNRAPLVDAGSAQLITNLFTTLAGTAHDDGFPSNVLNLTWTKVSGPGDVTFATNAPNTPVAFSTNGVYVLRLTADDLVSQASSDVTIYINAAPIVAAGADQTIILGQTTRLLGAYSDDGMPSGVTLHWQVVSGPGIASLDDPYAAQTDVAFNTAGVYVLRLTADDSQLQGFDELAITVVPPNKPPIVSAGSSQIVNFPGSVSLQGTAADDGLPEGSVLAVNWSKLTGPGAVIFGTASANDTTAAFDAPGVYVLAFAANDSDLSSTGYVAITVNDAPHVNAGADQITTLSNQLTLHGVVSDDGLPFGITNVSWSKVSGPGTVLFLSPTLAETAVRFGAVGEYVLRLSATDSNSISSDDVSISVRPDGANMPPLVSAGSSQVIALTNVAALQGSVTDDGLPYGTPLAITWSVVSGPGSVTFANSNAPATSAAFSVSGVYVLQLTANDSEFTRSAQVAISIYIQNQPPAVSAGADQTVIRGPVTLAGSASDDGFPTNHSLTVGWQKISGPGVASIEHTNSAVTAVTFSESGVYVFRFTASDGELASSADVTITVTGNQPPIAYAGADQVIDLVVAGGGGASTTTYPTQTDAWRYAPSQPGLSGLYGNVCCTPRVYPSGLSWSGTYLFLGGGFLNANGVRVQSIARWDGCSYSSLTDSVVGFVSDSSAIAPITARGNAAFACGGFLKDLDHNGFLDFTARWTGSNWTSWEFRIASSSVSGRAMASDANAVYFGGQFKFQTSSVPTAPVSMNLAKWDGTNWVALGKGIKDIRDDDSRNSIQFAVVTAIAIAANGDVYAGGSFVTQTATGLATNLARWTGSQWEVVDNRLAGCVGFNCASSVAALAFATNGDLIVGGNFTQAGSLTVNHVARWDGTNWFAYGSGFNSTVNALTIRGSDVFAGGNFTVSGSSNVSRVARFNGTSWVSLSNGVNSSVAALATTPSGVYMGGDFSAAGLQVANAITKWGVNEIATVNGPSPISVQTSDPSGASVTVVLQVKHPCGSPLTLTWNVDGGAAEFTNVVSGAVNFTSASFTNFYSAGVHTLLVTIADGQNPAITFSTTVTVLTPATLQLAGAITDDGLPSLASLTALWQEMSGPPNASFANPALTNTTASFTAIGTYVLRLTGNDSELQSSDDVTITVRAAGNPNRPPTVVAGENQDITVADAAALNGVVFDDGLPSNKVSIAWSKLSGPGAVSFNSPTSAVTSATFSAGGTYILRLTANDGEFSSYADLTVSVSSITNQPPVVSAGADQSVVAGFPARLDGAVSDDGLPYGTLTSSWSEQSGPGTVLFRVQNGIIYATFGDPGEYVLRLTANDGKATAFDEVAVTVYAASEAPSVVIASPLDSAAITSPTVVTGTVSSSILQGWSLQYRLKPGGDDLSTEGWAVLTTGTVAIADAPVGTFDPTLLLNGIYELKLAAADLAGRHVETEPITLVVDRNMKVGNFTLSFNDLTIPVAGIPIQVIRTYDSRDKRQGDFGIGWTLQINDIRLQKNRHQGRAWDQSSTGGLLPSYFIETPKQRMVTITFPDNKVYKFRAALSPASQFGVPLIYPRMTYEPMANTYGSLTPVFFNWRSGERTVDDQLVWGGDVPGRADFISYELLVDPPPGPADNILFNPDIFEFRTVEGYTYVISETNGMRSMTDPNGNTMLVTTNGLTWTNATGAASLSVAFLRDPLGRITNIVDALGHAMSYRYDTNGNLVTFTDREGGTNGFSYTPQHQLLAVADARGVESVRNDYDADGRLIRNIDANGQAITYTHDVDHRLDIVTNRLGYVTISEYDERGNVVQIRDANGAVTAKSYDANDNLISEVDPLGRTNSFAYDSVDNRISATDPIGNTIRLTYNNRRRITSATDPRGNTVTNVFDSQGNLIVSVDPRGRSTHFLMDEQGRLVAKTNALGHVTQFAYDPVGHLTNEMDPQGHAVEYQFDANGQRVSITTMRSTLGVEQRLTLTYRYDSLGRATNIIFPDGSMIRSEYDARGLPIAGVDQLGRQMRCEYDAYGHRIALVYPDNKSENFIYDAEGRVTAVTNRAGRVTSFRYDPMGRLIETIHPDGASTTNYFDPAGQLFAQSDALGRTSFYGYDLAGRFAAMTNALGAFSESFYDASGNVIRTIDPLGQTNAFVYDEFNRPFQAIGSDGGRLSVIFDDLGRQIAIADFATNRSWFAYDELGRVRFATNTLGFVTETEYNEIGQIIANRDANGRRTEFEYDEMGRLVRTLFADGSERKTFYDAAGRPRIEIDQNGKPTAFGYDVLDRLIAVTNALGQVTRYEYDDLGRKSAEIDANLHRTSFEYDALGRRTRRTLPDGTFETYDYDRSGRLASRTDFGGYTTLYHYDPVGRLIEKIPDPRFGQAPVAFGYDALGRRTNMVDASGVTTYLYDQRNRLVAKATPQGALAYGYDANGNVNSIQSSNPNGTSVFYGYDALNRLSQVSGAHIGAANYTYDPVGNLQSFAQPNGVTSLCQYDGLSRLTNLFLAKGLQSAIGKFSYGLAPGGNRVSAVEVSFGSPVNAQAWGVSRSYNYDDLYRLTGEAAGGSLGGYSMSYGYDPVGNRLSLDSTLPLAPSSTYAYDSNDRLLTDAYDASGNTTNAVMRDAYTGAQTVVSDRYDFENRLIERHTTINSQPATIYMTYDGDGNRVRKVVVTPTNSVDVSYLVDGVNPTGYSQVLEEITSVNGSPASVTRVYTYGHQIINQDQWSQGGGWTASFYGMDGHGSVRFLTDVNGAVTDTYSYDAFGILIAASGSTPNVYLFAGEQFDPDLNLYYLRARYHNPATGRFWGMDTFGGFGEDPRSLHKYAYAQNNPVNAIDPSGHFSVAEHLFAQKVGFMARVAYSALSGSIAGLAAATDAYISITGNRNFQPGNPEHERYLATSIRNSALISGGIGASIGFVFPGMSLQAQTLVAGVGVSLATISLGQAVLADDPQPGLILFRTLTLGLSIYGFNKVQGAYEDALFAQRSQLARLIRLQGRVEEILETVDLGTGKAPSRTEAIGRARWELANGRLTQNPSGTREGGIDFVDPDPRIGAVQLKGPLPAERPITSQDVANLAKAVSKPNVGPKTKVVDTMGMTPSQVSELKLAIQLQAKPGSQPIIFLEDAAPVAPPGPGIWMAPPIMTLFPPPQVEQQPQE